MMSPCFSQVSSRCMHGFYIQGQRLWIRVYPQGTLPWQRIWMLGGSGHFSQGRRLGLHGRTWRHELTANGMRGGVAIGGADSPACAHSAKSNLLNWIYPVSAATISSSGNFENQYRACAYWEPCNVAYPAFSKPDKWLPTDEIGDFKLIIYH